MTTVANINGANITRLRIMQMGSNRSQCVLAQAPIEDSETNKYVCSVENLVVSTDIPIFPKNTLAFVIYPVDVDDIPNILDPTEEIYGDLEDHYKCYVGPVYSFLDFIHQIHSFCNRYNQHTGNLTEGTIHVDASLATKKHFGLRGDHAFWSRHILYFPNEMGRVFSGLFGGEDAYHTYLANLDAGEVKTALWSTRAVVQEPFGTLQWIEDVVDYMFLEDPWEYGSTAVVTMKCKLDIFENRVGFIVDAVLPLPFELFCVNSNATDTRKGASKYGFLTLDFPEGKLTHKTIYGGFISDNLEIEQTLRTGIFRIVGDSRNSVGKKLLAGQLQDQRYELFLLRKVPQADGTVKILEEAAPFTQADFWSMDVVFTKQI